MSKVFSMNNNYHIILFEILSDNPNIEYIKGILESLDNNQLNFIFYEIDNLPLLHWASSCGCVNVVQLLYEFGYNINHISDGKIAIYEAIYRNEYDTVEYLINVGSDLQFQYYGFNPLAYAKAMKRNDNIIKLLENPLS